MVTFFHPWVVCSHAHFVYCVSQRHMGIPVRGISELALCSIFLLSVLSYRLQLPLPSQTLISFLNSARLLASVLLLLSHSTVCNQYQGRNLGKSLCSYFCFPLSDNHPAPAAILHFKIVTMNLLKGDKPFYLA